MTVFIIIVAGLITTSSVITAKMESVQQEKTPVVERRQ